MTDQTMTETTSPIRIYVDADACPVKDEIYRVANRYALRVAVVANATQRVPADPGVELIVRPGFGAADPPLRGQSSGGSTGLGLDIARRIAEASGGTLIVGRSASGGGSVTLGLGSPAGPPEESRRHRRARLRLRALPRRVGPYRDASSGAEYAGRRLGSRSRAMGRVACCHSHDRFSAMWPSCSSARRISAAVFVRSAW